jgi:signal peptidase I
MAPALRHGDQVLVWMRTPKRLHVGTVVVVDLPGQVLAVKRIARVADGRVWVYGDNPLGSTDSRTIGGVDRAAVRGVVLIRIWPRPGRLADPPLSDRTMC